jgi:lysophospholipase L1-like esterase
MEPPPRPRYFVPMRRIPGSLAFACCIFLMAPICAAADFPSTFIAARDARVAIMGRVAFDDAGSASMAFPGSVIRFVYRGPAPVLRFSAASEDCYFNLAVNGWEPVSMRLQKGANAVTVAAGSAPDSGYVVELTRRTESWQGVATFHGLDLPAQCELLPPPPWPERRLLFIGDSMTCGQYAERMPPENDASARTSNAGRAFGMLLGRRFDAQVHLVSYGGRGVLRDWEGRTDTGVAAQFFERALPDDAASHWDHGSYQPDLVVISLGQNDLSTGLPHEGTFLKAYADLIARVREVHPVAGIVLAESAMHGEEPGSENAARRAFLRATLESLVVRRRATGDTRILFAPLHKQPGTVHDSHPVAFQHERIAEALVGPIKQLTGW